MEKSLNDYINDYKSQIEIGNIPHAYKALMTYINGLRNHFLSKYSEDFALGSIYPGQMDITYFQLSPKSLKKHKLKTIIVFNHLKIQFEIWLAGQNRQIQKKYWTLFKDSDWKTYPVSPDLKGFSIMEHTLVQKPDFNNLNDLTDQIESEALKFIDNITEVLVE